MAGIAVGLPATGAVLQQGRMRDVRRGVCVAGLRPAAGGRGLPLGTRPRNARWTRHGGDDTRPPDYGGPVRRLSRGLSSPGAAFANGSGDPRFGGHDLGDVCAVLLLDFPRRSVYRATARQSPTDCRPFDNHSCGGGSRAQSGGMVRDPHPVCQGCNPALRPNQVGDP